MKHTLLWILNCTGHLLFHFLLSQQSSHIGLRYWNLCFDTQMRWWVWAINTSADLLTTLWFSHKMTNVCNVNIANINTLRISENVDNLCVYTKTNSHHKDAECDFCCILSIGCSQSQSFAHYDKWQLCRKIYRCIDTQCLVFIAILNHVTRKYTSENARGLIC